MQKVFGKTVLKPNIFAFAFCGASTETTRSSFQSSREMTLIFHPFKSLNLHVICFSWAFTVALFETARCAFSWERLTFCSLSNGKLYWAYFSIIKNSTCLKSCRAPRAIFVPAPVSAPFLMRVFGFRGDAERRRMHLALYSNSFLPPTVQASKVRKITGRADAPSAWRRTRAASGTWKCMTQQSCW